MMNNRNTSSDEDDNGDLTNPGAGMNGSEIRGYKAILLTPGPIVSLSRLLSKSKLRGITIKRESGAAAGKMLIDNLAKRGIGQVCQLSCTPKQHGRK